MKTETKKPVEILVVDDTPSSQEILHELLEEAGFRVKAVNSGEEAINQVSQPFEQPDFIVMDQVLGPGAIDGLMATRAIKKQFPQVRTIVMTLYGDGESSRQALESGAWRYVFRGLDMAEAVNEIISLVRSAPELSLLEKKLQNAGLLDTFWREYNQAIGIVDRSYRVLYANPLQDQLAGKANSRGGICWVEWHDATQQKGPCPWCPVRPLFEGRQATSEVVPLLQGTEMRYWQTGAAPIRDAHGQVIAAVKWDLDVDEQEKLHLETLEAQNPEQRLRNALDQIRLLGYSRARLYELTGDGRILVGRVQVTDEPSSEPFQPRFLLEDDLAAREALAKRTPVIYTRQPADPVEVDVPPGREGLAEWIELPMLVKDKQGKRVLGMIEIDNKVTGPVRPDRPSNPAPLTTAHFKRFLTIGRFAASAINEGRRFEEIIRKLDSLVKLGEIDGQIAQVLDEEVLLRSIVQKAVELLKGSGGSLSRCYPEKQQVVVEINWQADYLQGMALAYGEGLTGRVALNGKPRILNHYFDDPDHSSQLERQDRKNKFVSAVAAPLLHEGQVIGVLVVLDKNPERMFQSYDSELLESFASRAVIAIQNARLFKEKEKQARQLNAINDVVMFMQAEDNLETALRLALTGVTAGHGLHFSRAILFLPGKDGKKLEGRLAIGPLTSPESHRIWQESKLMTLREHLEAVIQWEPEPHDPLESLIRAVALPLEVTHDPLVRAFLEQKPHQEAPLKVENLADPRMVETLCPDGAAFIPLVARDKALGVLVVDNRFLPSTEIQADDLKMVETLASHMAIRLENHFLVQQLEDRFGEIAHELRSPLFPMKINIEQLAAGRIKGKREAYDVILAEILGIERMVTEILSLKKIEAGQFTLTLAPMSLKSLVKKVVSLYRRSARDSKVKLRTGKLRHRQDTLQGDETQLINALATLVENAIKFSSEGQTIYLRTCETGKEMIISVLDHGCGIPAVEQAFIFNKYFRGKLAKERGIAGTGIGLGVAQFIVEQHGGRIEFSSQVDQGSNFKIILPKSIKSVSGPRSKVQPSRLDERNSIEKKYSGN